MQLRRAKATTAPATGSTAATTPCRSSCLVRSLQWVKITRRPACKCGSLRLWRKQFTPSSCSHYTRASLTASALPATCQSRPPMPPTLASPVLASSSPCSTAYSEGLVYDQPQKPVVLIGRDPGNTIILTDAVSQASLRDPLNGHCWQIRDLGSTNGVWVYASSQRGSHEPAWSVGYRCNPMTSCVWEKSSSALRCIRL